MTASHQRGRVSATPVATNAPSQGRANAVDSWLLQRMLTALGRPPIRIRLWDGSQVSPPGIAPEAEMRIADRGILYRLVSDPELQFGEGYSQGRIQVEGDLVRFIELVYAGLMRTQPDTLSYRLRNRLDTLRRNGLDRARRNIYHHYDIGNDFYRLWLDRQLVYTCAYFPSPETDLEAAQIAKFDHVARKLWLRPGERVVEAGCGWGALALHLARNFGARVRAYNISREQLAYARERARSEGLDGQVEFVEGDYREITGEYDVFVSVGMLEHVGPAHYGELGAAMDRCLGPEGRGLIHSIGRDRPGSLNRWIERRIFPGAQPPAISQMTALFEPWGFSVLDLENLRLHYARTLEHWRARFEAHAGQVREQFDPDFERAWRLYLAGSVAAFRYGTLQLFQVLFSRSQSNAIPWTRAHLYKG
jgi:cyclopropane-fatty-acyl-phospholipid synthase